MLTSKERAELRSQANKLSAIFSLGKDGISKEFSKAIDSALEARELVKINILQNCDITAREAADELSVSTRSEVVQVIGGKFVLYRKSVKKAVAPAVVDSDDSKSKKGKRPYRNFRR